MASGTDPHNGLFQQNSSRFTFFSEYRAQKSGPGLSCLCAEKNDAVYLNGAGKERFLQLCIASEKV